MGVRASQFTSLAIVHSTVYSDADQGKHQSSASLAFANGIHRGPVNSPHKLRVTGLCAWNSPGTREFPAQMASNAFDDVIMFQDDQIALKPYLTATSFQMRC